MMGECVIWTSQTQWADFFFCGRRMKILSILKIESEMDGFGEENISPPSVFDCEQDDWVSIPQDSPVQQVCGWL